MFSVELWEWIVRWYLYFQASDVGVQPECVKVFNEIKIGHKYRYIVYALTDDLREIQVLKTGSSCEYFGKIF